MMTLPSFAGPCSDAVDDRHLHGPFALWYGECYTLHYAHISEGVEPCRKLPL